MALRSPAQPWAETMALGAFTPLVLGSLFGVARLSIPRPPAREPEASSFDLRSAAPLAAALLAMALQIALLSLAGRLMPLYRPSALVGGAGLTVAMVCGTLVGPFAAFWLAGRRRRPEPLVGLFSAAAVVTGAGVFLLHGEPSALLVALIYGGAIAGLSNLTWEKVAVTVASQAPQDRNDLFAFAVLTASVDVGLALSSAALTLIAPGVRADSAPSLYALLALLVLGGLGTYAALAKGAPRREALPA